MGMKFTYSVAMAINAMLQLWRGELREWLQGQELEYGHSDNRTLLPRPTWTNFVFFRKIRALPIKRKERVERRGEEGSHWVMERVVEFYHGAQLVGVVQLRGKKYDSFLLERKNLDDRIMWGIDRISYRSAAGGEFEPFQGYQLMATGYEVPAQVED